LRLPGQLPGELRRIRQRHRLRNAVFDKVLKQGAEFFEAHSTGQLMSSIMNDVDKVQVATSQILADLLRQFFSAVFPACTCSSATIGGWR
jgi:ABC-type multidrug transport system fused ATPase/permease subunit